MNYLSDNLAALEARDPALAQRVLVRLDQSGRVTAARDSSGTWNLIVREAHDRHWLYPIPLAPALAATTERLATVANPQLVLWFGFGLGHHLDHALAHPHPHQRFHVIIEPQLDWFISSLECRDLRPLLQDSRYFWVVGVQRDILEFHLYDICHRPDVMPYVHCNAAVDLGLHPEYFQDIGDVCQRVISDIVNATVAMECDDYMGLRNVLANLDTIAAAPLLSDLPPLFAGRPGIVVATGPSLSLTLPHLQHVADHAVLFAVDSALRFVQRAGITPQLTGCLERQIITREHFQDLDTTRTTWIGSPLVHPATFATFLGPKVFVVRPHHFLPWLFPEAPTHGRAMSSVSHLALFVLHTLGCRPIYLVGQDLAYDPTTQQSHASGYAFDQDAAFWDTAGHAACRAPANHGGEIASIDWWMAVARYLGHMIRECDIECINVIPTTHGMVIPHTTRRDPAEAFGPNFPRATTPTPSLHDLCTQWRQQHHTTRNQQIGTTLTTTQQWIDALHRQLTTHLHTAYDLLEHLPHTTDLNPILATLAQLDRHAVTITQHPYFQHLLWPITQARGVEVLRHTISTLHLPPTTPDAVRTKLQHTLNWFHELLVKATLVQRQIQQAKGSHVSLENPP